MLRDSGRALRTPGDLHVDGTHDALRIDPLVLVEAFVLGGYDALDYIVGDLTLVDGAAILQIVLADHRVISRIHGGGLGNEVGICRGVVRELAEPVCDERSDREKHCHHEQGYEAEESGYAEAYDMSAGTRACPAGTDAHECLLAMYNHLIIG